MKRIKTFNEKSKEDLLLEKRIEEIMDKALKNIKKKVDKKSGEATYEFTIEGNTPNINEYSTDVKFEVSFHSVVEASATIEIAPLNGTRVRFFATSLTFRNDVSGMSELSVYMMERGEYDLNSRGEKIPKKFSSTLIYGTMGRILNDYLSSVPPEVVQGVKFTTAHSGLVLPYIILSKESEKKGDLVWLNPIKYTKQSFGSFSLLRKSMVDIIKNKINSN